MTLVLAVVVLAGVWIKGRSGSKQADLAATLLSGVIVGSLLLVVEWLFTTEARKRQTEASLESTGEAAPKDETALLSEKADTLIAPGGPATDTGLDHRYRVEYEGTIRDTSRIDAQQLRLRVFQDDDYFQFFTVPVPVPVPSPELRGFIGADPNVRPGQLWLAIGQAAGPLIEDTVLRGEVPLESPINSYEVFPDIERAVKLARSTNEPDVEVGQTIYWFEV